MTRVGAWHWRKIFYNGVVPNPSLINDILFKIVFGTSSSEPVLVVLLNALLGYTGEQKIVSLMISNPAMNKETKGSY